jgi:hypothetical protein
MDAFILCRTVRQTRVGITPVCGELLILGKSVIRHTHHRLQTAGPQSVEQDPEQAVDCEQPGPVRPLAAKNVQLMTQGEIL